MPGSYRWLTPDPSPYTDTGTLATNISTEIFTSLPINLSSNSTAQHILQSIRKGIKQLA
jgi:hypothetical protein